MVKSGLVDEERRPFIETEHPYILHHAGTTRATLANLQMISATSQTLSALGALLPPWQNRPIRQVEM